MTDDEKKAAIEAEYMPLIKELAANTDPLATLAAILLAGDMHSAQEGRAEAVEIEK